MKPDPTKSAAASSSGNVYLQVDDPISSVPQPVRDSYNNYSTLFISTLKSNNAAASIVGGGTLGVQATLGLATFPDDENSPAHRPANGNVQIQAVDNGDYTANLNFVFSHGNPTATSIALTLLSNGGLQAPSLANLPSSGYAPLVVDSQGKIYVGTISSSVAPV